MISCHTLGPSQFLKDVFLLHDTRQNSLDMVVVGVNWDRRGHQHHSTLLLRMGKKPKSPFGGLHLLPLLLPLLLLQLLSKN
jgi:hypothetical protein